MRHFGIFSNNMKDSLLCKIEFFSLSLSPFLFIPDETYYGNFVASHPLPHFGSCAHQGIEKIQPSMWVQNFSSSHISFGVSSSFIQNFFQESLKKWPGEITFKVLTVDEHWRRISIYTLYLNWPTKTFFYCASCLKVLLFHVNLHKRESDLWPRLAN